VAEAKRDCERRAQQAGAEAQQPAPSRQQREKQQAAAVQQEGHMDRLTCMVIEACKVVHTLMGHGGYLMAEELGRLGVLQQLAELVCAARECVGWLGWWPALRAAGACAGA
jgi:hypothetical protein